MIASSGGLRRYFDQNEMPELTLQDLGAEHRIVSSVYGYSPSELRIENKNGFLTISGEKRQTFSSPDRQMESTSVSSFRKTIRAPKGTASASLLDGKLTISIPKR
jgi:HSP20 family molecular chaperone IbpA